MSSIFYQFNWLSFFRIACDIILVFYLIYRTLLLVRGTRAGRMLMGLAMVAVVYFAAVKFELPSLTWILGNFLGSVILVIVVLFQDDLRRGLTKVGLIPGLSREENIHMDQTVKAIAKAAQELSNRKIGALMVVQREVGLEEFTEAAVEIDGKLSHQILIALFQLSSPLHDGAVVIAGDRIVAAGAVLPLTFNPELSSNFGTRHRAAIGLSERTDASIVVVSEETGVISLIREGRITRELNESTLYTALHRATVFVDSKKRLKRFQDWMNSARKDTQNRGSVERG